MSSQTVYFTNPATISQIQGQVGSTAGQITTGQVNATKQLFADKYTFPGTFGPYQVDMISVVVKATVAAQLFGNSNLNQGTGGVDARAYYELVIAVPSSATGPQTTQIYKTSATNVIDNLGTNQVPFEDYYMSMSNSIIYPAVGGSNFASIGISPDLNTKFNNLVLMCNSGTTSTGARNAILSDIQADPEYITIRDNVKYPVKYSKMIPNGSGGFIFDQLKAMDGITNMINTGATGTAYPTVMSRTDYNAASQMLPVVQNVNAQGGKMGLYLELIGSGGTTSPGYGDTWHLAQIASLGYVAVQAYSYPWINLFNRYDGVKTITKMWCDKEVDLSAIQIDSPYYEYNTDTKQFSPYYTAGTTYGTADYVNVYDSIFATFGTGPTINQERYLYEIKCVLNQLGLASSIDFNNTVVQGNSLGGNGFAFLHKCLPNGRSTLYQDPVTAGTGAQLYRVKAFINSAGSFMDRSAVVNGVNPAVITNLVDRNNKECFRAMWPLKTPMINITGDADFWFPFFGAAVTNYFNSQSAVIFQESLKQVVNNYDDTVAANCSLSASIYTPAAVHFNYYNNVSRGLNADGEWGTSYGCGLGFNINLATGWYCPLTAQWPSVEDPVQVGGVPNEFLTVQMETLRRSYMFTMLAHRFLGPNWPVPIEAFRNFGYRVDLNPSQVEANYYQDWMKVGPKANITYNSNYDVTIDNAGLSVATTGAFGSVLAGNLTATNLVANSLAVTSSALPATDTTIAYKIPVVVNGTTYYISLTAAQ
jgi:hypothetical protein